MRKPAFFSCAGNARSGVLLVRVSGVAVQFSTQCRGKQMKHFKLRCEKDKKTVRLHANHHYAWTVIGSVLLWSLACL
jgi:hypothetical protein